MHILLQKFLKNMVIQEMDEKHRKPNSIAILNLISPRIDYKNYGKSEIRFKSFLKIVLLQIFQRCKQDTMNQRRILIRNLTANTFIDEDY